MLNKTLLTLTANASLILAGTAMADPHYTDAQIVVIAKKCGVSFKFAKEALDAGFHYNPVDNSLEGGYRSPGETDQQSAEAFNRAKARNFQPQWLYVEDTGPIWIRDADGGAKLYHYNLMRVMKGGQHMFRTQVRLDNGTWVWVRKDY
jgi:hypothetical protein